MSYECIKVNEKSNGAISEITLGPAPANILTEKVMEEISQQLTEDEKKPHKKMIIFTSEGKHFSFGASVEEHKPGKVQSMLPGFHTFINGIINCSIPTLSRVSGLCLGGSFELALACTYIFADTTAKFAVPEIQLGVFPPVACALLPLKGADQLAAHMILTGEQVKAQNLQQLGIIYTVTEKGDLDTKIEEYYNQFLATKSASSLRIAHRASRMVQAELYKQAISKLESLYLDELMETQDGVEGINAFLEKRSPQWRDV